MFYVSLLVTDVFWSNKDLTSLFDMRLNSVHNWKTSWRIKHSRLKITTAQKPFTHIQLKIWCIRGKYIAFLNKICSFFLHSCFFWWTCDTSINSASTSVSWESHLNMITASPFAFVTANPKWHLEFFGNSFVTEAPFFFQLLSLLFCHHKVFYVGEQLLRSHGDDEALAVHPELVQQQHAEVRPGDSESLSAKK